jgi:Kef-type K+ transport system membrane component KefB
MTPTALASAIPGTSLARGLFIVALALGSGNANAQRSAQPATPPTAPASWDTLYSQHRFFDLRDAVRAHGGTTGPDAQFYRGVVAHAFNDNDDAISSLAPLIDSMPRGFSRSHLADAVDALGDSYARVFRYRESAAAYRRALHINGVTLDTAARSLFTRRAELADALASVPPQRIRWTAESNTSPVPNDSVAFAAVALINGAAPRARLGVDAGARFTIIDSTTAATHKVRILKDSVRTAVGGRLITAQLGVARSLDIGTAHLANVVVVVAPDDSLQLIYMRYPVSGIIGLPVLSSLGSVTFTRDGHIALSSPGADNDSSAAPNMILADGAAAVNASYDDTTRIALLLDSRAPRTLLYPSFLRAFPSATRSANLTTYVGTEYGGGVTSMPSYLIPSITLGINGRPIRIGSIHALMRDGDFRAQFYAGALGQDALQTADRVTLDFAAMTLRFRDPPQTTVLPKIVYPTGTVGAPSPVSKVPGDIAFVALLFALFVVPKALQRYRLPSAITSLLMGAGATALGLFHNDPTLHLLSTFGIVALFLFAGLEIDGHELRRQASPLIVHGIVWSVVLAVGSAIAAFSFGFATRPAVLIALALLTPSTGFILSSLSGFGLLDGERFAVKTYVIGSELLALMVLFFVLQSTSVGRLAFAVAAMIGVVTIIPLMFRLFARLVAPHAPRSEFAFLLMVAIVCAYATTRLGVYYLVGAFLVGIAAQRFRSELPAMSSEKMVDALESFGSVFIPFYFFHAGTEIVREQITTRAIVVGLVLIALLIPIRIGITMLQRRFFLKDSTAVARRIGIALVPTLVFTLVIVDILNTNFGVEKYVLGALVLYTVINTSIPAFVLHSAPPEFENVEAADIV